jgi:hypothetical protein
MAVAVAPLTTTVMSAISGEHSGLASGVNNAVSRTAGLLAIALMGIVIVAVFGSALDSRLSTLRLAPDAVRQIDAGRASLAELGVPSGLDSQSHDAVQVAIADSFVTGFRVVMIVAAVLTLASAVSAGVLISGGKAT